VPAVRKAVVMLDAGFEAVLATVLLMGVLYADIDATDFPSPVTDTALAVFALALYVLAVVLATFVKNESVTDRKLAVLAAGNALFAVLLAVWVSLSSGFTPAGRAVSWVTIVALLSLATAQALARRSR
jgi:hypothetical protein